MTQWTQVWVGASGSSTIRAKSLVLGGTPFQLNSGETLSPSQEAYLAGIMPPSLKEELWSLRVDFFLSPAAHAAGFRRTSGNNRTTPIRIAGFNLDTRASLSHL